MHSSSSAYSSSAFSIPADAASLPRGMRGAARGNDPMAALKRLTVSFRELASLGVVHGTLAKVREALGLGPRHELSAMLDEVVRPTTAEIAQMPMTVQLLWPRQLMMGAGIFVGVVAFALLLTNHPQPPPPAAANVPLVATQPEAAALAPAEADTTEAGNAVRAPAPAKTRSILNKRRLQKRRQVLKRSRRSRRR